MKDQIKKYIISGSVFIWKYKDNYKNYPGWNLTVDEEAGQNLLKLLNLMEKCQWSSQKTLKTSIPTNKQISVPNNQSGQAEWRTINRVTLKSRKTDSPDLWQLIENKDELEIQFGYNKLNDLKNSIEKVLQGKGDFALSNNNDGQLLYFWWNLANKKNSA